MLKAKLSQFKLSIRRQQKNKLFAQMRKQHQQINHVQEILGRIFELDLVKYNFENFKNLFKSINQNLVEYSKLGSKGRLLDVRILLCEKGDIPFSPLERMGRKFTQLNSKKFKEFVLDLFQEVHKVRKVKIQNQWRQISQQLFQELALMIGLLFKEPLSLAMLFPFSSIREYLQNSEECENGQTQSPQNTFQTSFELFENNIKLLKFYSIKNANPEQLILLLSIVHSISTVLKFFVINNKHTKKITLNNKTNSDRQQIIYFFSFLKSHNFQNCIQQIFEELIDVHCQDSTFPLLREQSIFISLLSLVSNYCKFMKFGNFSMQSLSFIQGVRRFYCFTLKVHFFEKNEGSMLKQSSQTHLRILFGLHSLNCQSILSLSQKESLPLCYEMIQFLSNRTKQMQEESKYENTVETEPRTKIAEFYFNVLVAEQGQRWIHFLQILISLQELVTNYDISIDEIMNYSLQNNMEFSPEAILRFFEEICYSITTISGYFYNQRHIFSEALVSLFVVWSGESLNKDNCVFQGLLWIEIGHKLCKLMDEIEFSIKSNSLIDTNYNEGKLKKIQEVQIDSNNRQKESCQTVRLIEDLKNILQIRLQQIANESQNAPIQIDI